MAPLLHRRNVLLTLAALAAGGCASDPDNASANPDGEGDALASLPVRVLMVQGFAGVHRALESQQIIPTRVLVESGNGSVPVVAQNLNQWLQKENSCDVVVAPQGVMKQLLAQGLLRAESLMDLVRTPLVLMVQAGRPIPALQTPEQLRVLLQNTPSLAYPSSDESRFIEQELLPQLGIKEAVLGKSIKVFGPQVAAVVGRGDAELGLQMLSEVKGAQGVSNAGPLPAPFDYATVYTAAIARHAPSVAGAEAVMRFYQRESALHDWAGTGWETVAKPSARER